MNMQFLSDDAPLYVPENEVGEEIIRAIDAIALRREREASQREGAA